MVEGQSQNVETPKARNVETGIEPGTGGGAQVPGGTRRNRAYVVTGRLLTLRYAIDKAINAVPQQGDGQPQAGQTIIGPFEVRHEVMLREFAYSFGARWLNPLTMEIGEHGSTTDLKVLVCAWAKNP